MLLGLTIRDVVLIERLELALGPGLCVLTGETGAGKSILLDALGLALGARADSGLVRHGASQAAVAAEFRLSASHPAWAVLAEQGLAVPPGGSLVLRRVLSDDGRSRAFINDEPVGVALLRRVGDTLVEIQGQFEQRGLLDPASHRALLDSFGGNETETGALRAAWRKWRDAAAARAETEALLARSREEEDLLRHNLAELEALKPRAGEEEHLAGQKTLLANREKIVAGGGAALEELTGEGGALRRLHSARRQIERLRDRAGPVLEPAMAALERAAVETEEAAAQIEAALREIEFDGNGLERIEERLYALRGLARKHGVAADALPELRERIAHSLSLLDDRGDELRLLMRAETEGRDAYAAAAKAVSARRRAAAARLDEAVRRELGPLRLGSARFYTVVEDRPEGEWGEFGWDRVAFEVATNPGAPPGPLTRIASGGELSRFMLALKVVLAESATVPTLVFDEVDSGVGGAVADAVGDRLRRLGGTLQILVVTHSPQVAARGAHHWHIFKEQKAGATRTQVMPLDEESRREEIARMLSGSLITAEARAAAASLIAGGRS